MKKIIVALSLVFFYSANVFSTEETINSPKSRRNERTSQEIIKSLVEEFKKTNPELAKTINPRELQIMVCLPLDPNFLPIRLTKN